MSTRLDGTTSIADWILHYEFDVLCAQFLEMHGNLAIQASFQDHISREHQAREQPRFRTLSNSQVFLVVSAPGIGEFMASFGKLNIKRSVEDAIQILSLPDGKYINFKKKFDEEAPLVECAPNEINQCLLFILQNAINAVGRDGVIEITTAYDILSDRIHITIIDNGCGMSAETMKHMFDPFFTTKPVGSGTGVGLSITERIIKRHNGSIKVKSKEGEGTTVTMVLPIFGDFAKSN